MLDATVNVHPEAGRRHGTEFIKRHGVLHIDRHALAELVIANAPLNADDIVRRKLVLELLPGFGEADHLQHGRAVVELNDTHATALALNDTNVRDHARQLHAVAARLNLSESQRRIVGHLVLIELVRMAGKPETERSLLLLELSAFGP